MTLHTMVLQFLQIQKFIENAVKTREMSTRAGIDKQCKHEYGNAQLLSTRGQSPLMASKMLRQIYNTGLFCAWGKTTHIHGADVCYENGDKILHENTITN